MNHPNSDLIDFFGKEKDQAAKEGHKGHIIHNSRMIKILKDLPKINSPEDLIGQKGVGQKSIDAISIAMGFDPKEFSKTKKRKNENTLPEPKKEKKENLPSLLLAQSFDPEKHDASGWLMSEKLDGLRAYWCGKTFWSRRGNQFNAPEWFTKHMPSIPLDGELYSGRGRFGEISGTVRKHIPVDEEWQDIRFHVFDSPDGGQNSFEERLELIKNHIGEDNPMIEMVKHIICTGNDHVSKALDETVDKKGEGLMLRQPGSKYEGKRSKTLLKVKKAYDAEAKVIGYLDGKGRNTGRCGSLICEMESGAQFKCGSGLTDEIRDNPPHIGSIITYQFTDITKKSKVPLFPVFLRERQDAEEAKDYIFE